MRKRFDAFLQQGNGVALVADVVVTVVRLLDGNHWRGCRFDRAWRVRTHQFDKAARKTFKVPTVITIFALVYLHLSRDTWRDFSHRYQLLVVELFCGLLLGKHDDHGRRINVDFFPDQVKQHAISPRDLR